MMEQLLGFETELGGAAAVFAAVLAANAVRWAWRRLGDYVRKTPNKIDDKIFAAAKEAMEEVLEIRTRKDQIQAQRLPALDSTRLP